MSHYEAWQIGRSIPDIIAAFDDREEKALRKGMKIASINLKDGKDYIVKNVADSSRRSETLATLDKLLSKGNTGRGVAQAMLGFAPIINADGAARDAFFDQVFSRELIGYGYAVPRRPEDVPTRIPDDVWEGKIDWSKSAVNGSGLSFVSVRLVDSEYDHTVPDAMPDEESMPTPPESSKVGRPTKKQLILEAFDYGVANKLIDCSKSNKAIYNQVFQLIRAHWPAEFEGGKGLGDTPMRKHLAEKIKVNRL